MAIYEYRAKCLRVIDGDTVHLEVDLGFRMSTEHHFRLLGIDTPELRGGTVESKNKAQQAKRRVKELLFVDPDECTTSFDLLIHTEKADSFGRWLAKVMVFTDLEPVAQWVDISDILIKEGHGVPYAK